MDSFSNISRLPSGSCQLRFKRDNKKVEPVVKSLPQAIWLRNELYLNVPCRPPHYFVKIFGEDVLRPCTKIDRAGLLKDYWQVHSRSLVDRKYRPRTFASHLDAIEFVSKWLPSYNEVARLYNVEREKEFKRLIEQELKTLKPLLSCSFDKALWYRCAVSIYGANVPMYFTE
ncbi:hypothetical protein [Vibrio chaetopteri]|uniref:Uncharacterized protein n=1 Tax=Vibrio chaetopteri TaxID=3016528 RepID=A0AAU8BSJ6_9VIBR